jgi:hypothetical protein
VAVCVLSVCVITRECLHYYYVDTETVFQQRLPIQTTWTDGRDATDKRDPCVG